MATEKRRECVAAAEKAGVQNLCVRITEAVHEIGVPENLPGYEYALRSIESACYSLMAGREFVRSGFEPVAEEFQTNCTDIERGIMRAVEAAWDADIQICVAEKYFYQRGIPSTMEFITMVAKYLMDEES